jgi:tRNA(Ile)-lysidine synthase
MLEEILAGACRLDPSQPVLAGVSGGPDSLCLLGVLHSAGYRVTVAHFNHRLRPSADLEAEAVSGLARRLDLPFVSDSADVRGEAEQQGLSLEEAARRLRYRFLFAAARHQGAQAVAVGHTADDQAETVLMHFLRGSGLDGLKGMQYRTLLVDFDPELPLVRPLLGLRRSETEAYCRAHGLEPHLDPSNADPAYFRNRLRHVLLPELEKYNPRLREALARTAGALQGDFALLQEVLDEAWKQVAAGQGDGWFSFDRAGLTALSPALRRNLLRRAGERLRPQGHGFDFAALERAAAFAGGPAGERVDFTAGLYLFAEGQRLYLAAYEADLPSAGWPQVGGELVAGSDGCGLGNGWRLTVVKVEPEAGDLSAGADPWSAGLDADRAAGRLTVRPRRPGERFAPFGLDGGTVRLQDFFVNVKLPRRARAGWPLVCVGDQIAWVPGYRIADPLRVTEKTQRVMRLKIQKK